jgi:hypothetical protein
MVKKVALLLLAVFMAFTVLIGCQQDEPQQDPAPPPATDEPATQPETDDPMMEDDLDDPNTQPAT